MKRTRKWAYVAQEAQRLAGLGLAPVEIAKRLGVRRNTVQRWMADGKLADTRRGGAGQKPVTVPRSAGEWGKSVRSSYALDADDEELVRSGEFALLVRDDVNESTATRLAAAGRFQAIVKQLALVARAEPQPESKDEKPKVEQREHRRTGTDPRTVLMVVSK